MSIGTTIYVPFDNVNIDKILTKTMKKDKKITTIKGRIIELIENQGENISIFLPSIGLSYSNFKGKQLESSPSADILVKIKSKFSNANIDWILTGEGEMLIQPSKEEESMPEIFRQILKEKDYKIEQLIADIVELKIENRELKKMFAISEPFANISEAKTNQIPEKY